MREKTKNEERSTDKISANEAQRTLPRDTQLYAAAMEPLAYRAAEDLVAAASIRLGPAYDQAWYDVGMQRKHVASMFISARFIGPGKTPEPASPTSAAASSQQRGHSPEPASPSSAAEVAGERGCLAGA